MNLFDFSDWNILITGASSGIGKSVAKYLSECGATVILVARNTDRLIQTSLELPKNCKIFTYDLTNLEAIHQIFDFCQHQNILLRGMVHCAGICPLMTVKENDISLMVDTFKINYFAFIELVKYFSDERYSFDKSSIVAISSDAAVLGGFRQAIYSGSKAALNTSVKSMAKELHFHRKIRINTIMPSAVETEMLETLREKSVNLNENILARQLFGIIQPDNIAGLVGYLLSDMGKYMTGLSIPVNGGYIY
jgi:short-subunit dehydrogenase